jgi:hypothetical protein
MGEQRPLIEQWLDLAVYAPIGLLVAAQEDLPALVQRGRERAENRVQVARFFGQMAVAYARVEAQKRREAASRPTTDGAAPIPATAVEVMPDIADTVAPIPEPFAGYDALAAVHVVERLRRMSPAELHAVHEYESAHRGRRTVLGKIDQLLK